MNIEGVATEDIRLGGSTDRRAVRTRKALQDAFIDLLLQVSLNKISPREIAAQAGVARGSFYLHYASKEALFEEITNEAIDTLFKLGLNVLDEAGSYAAALSNCKHISETRNVWCSLLNGGAKAMIQEKLTKLAKGISSERAIVDDRLPAELSAAFSSCAMVEIISWWLRQDDHYSEEFVATMMVEMVFNPIRSISTSTVLKFGHVSASSKR